MESDPSLSLIESLYKGLYFGDILPSLLDLDLKPSLFPKNARLLWKVTIKARRQKALYELTLYGGAPCAEDRYGLVMIHDMPKIHHRLDKMTSVLLRTTLKTGLNIPLRYYTIGDDDRRTFTPFRNVVLSEKHISLAPCLIINRPSSRVHMILAPSGSGKSYFCMNNDDVVDGDNMLIWPDDPTWINSIQTRRKVNSELWMQIKQMHGSDKVVLYNGDVGELPPYWEKWLTIHSIVLPSLRIHKRNLYARTLKKGGDNVQPTDWELIEGNRNQLHKFAKAHSIRIWHSFLPAVNEIAKKALYDISDAVPHGKTTNHPITAFSRLSLDGKLTGMNIGTHSFKFGTHISFRIHTNEYARACRVNGQYWKHVTRMLPAIYICGTIGFKCSYDLTNTGYIDKVHIHIRDNAKNATVEVNPSGHMLNALINLCFPNDVCGMPTIAPDFGGFVSAYLHNQYTSTQSLEPQDITVAFHSWIETYIGIIGSYYGVKLLLRNGFLVTKKNFILWRAYCKAIIRRIAITERTTILRFKSKRDLDPRFTPY